MVINEVVGPTESRKRIILPTVLCKYFAKIVTVSYTFLPARKLTSEVPETIVAF